MSRCRKDDSRFGPSGAGPQQQQQRGSPSRHHYGSPVVVTGLLQTPAPVPSAAGHNYIRSKAKDKDRTDFIAKDRIKNTNTVKIHGRSFAQEKPANIRSPTLNNGEDPIGTVRGELSWADEVELTLPNNGPQRPNVKDTVVETAQLVNVMDHNAVEMKTTAASNDSQKIVTESEKKLSKDINANPPTEFSNGRTKQHGERDHDPAYYKRANCPQPRRGSRKKTLSLNPEEREALENLIEEVLMDGAIDSDSASSDDETEQSESWKNANVEGQGVAGCGTSNAGASREEVDQKTRNDKGKMGRKYYPGQLKVALKHMTELPPRFSRKLKKAEKYLELNTVRNSVATTGRIEEEDEESVNAAREEKRLSVSPRPPEREKEKAKLKEHHAKEFKRSIRTLLRDHNQYVEDGGVSNSSSIHPPGAIICEDLERETLSMQGAPSAELAAHDVPSSVQNLMLAAKGLAAVDTNLLPEESFHETEVASNNFIGTSNLMPQRFTGSYVAQDTSSGGQFMMSIPEFVPAGMIPAYSSPEILRPEQQQQHVQQYAAALLIDQTLGAVSGCGSDPVSMHGLSSEQMSVMGQVSPSAVPTSSLPGELMSTKMMEFSASVPPPPMTFGTSLAGLTGEKITSPMTSTYVPNEAQIPMSTMPSPGALPFYQFQGQNMPPPPASYAFAIQAPYSSSQYCFMPPALQPQTMPPAYYPRDQSPYPMDAIHFKSAVNPDWGYQKSKQFANNIPTVPTYSSYSNLNIAPLQYPTTDSVNNGINQLNSTFRQRKKQSGSNISPRTMGSSSSVGSGKLLNQRAKQNENLSTPLGRGHRPGQEVMTPSLQLENGLTAPAFGDSTPKRLQINVRNRAFGDGLSYPGRRENRNFASEKYASPRTFGSDGKKEGRHVILKPKQTKPNRSSTRSRNDATITQLSPVKPYHPSDLSEEGLESPDNFGDVESGADDWSTDNYDQEVSRKAKHGDSVEACNELKVASPEKEVIMLDTTLEMSEKLCILPGENVSADDVHENTMTDRKGAESGLSSPEKQSGVAFDDSNILEPVDGVCISTNKHSPDMSSVLDEDLLNVKEVDRSILEVENVKKVAEVQARLTICVSSDGNILDQMNSLLLQPADDGAASVDHVDDVNDTLLTEEPTLDVSHLDAHLYPETSIVDVELFDEAVEYDRMMDVNPEGMKLVLGSKFVCHLRKMFEGSFCTELPCLPMTVHLSHGLLTQLHKEIFSQVNVTSDNQNALGNKSSVEETEKLMGIQCHLQEVDASSLTKEQADHLDLNQIPTGGSSHHESIVSDDCKTKSVFSCDVTEAVVTHADEL